MEKYHGNTIEYWKQNAEENYLTTPISVLKYITVLEEQAERLRQSPVIKSVCDGCGSKFDAMDISVGVCYCCQKEIKQTYKK